MDTTDVQRMFDVDGMGRSFLIGSVVGGLLTFLVTGGITLLATQELGPALVVGGFAGFWGGPGFGGMLGAVTAATRAEDAARMPDTP